jgi:hypothetical protein
MKRRASTKGAEAIVTALGAGLFRLFSRTKEKTDARIYRENLPPEIKSIITSQEINDELEKLKKNLNRRN